MVDGLTLVSVGAEVLGIHQHHAREGAHAVFKVGNLRYALAVPVGNAGRHGDGTLAILSAVDEAVPDEAAAHSLAGTRYQSILAHGNRFGTEQSYLQLPCTGGGLIDKDKVGVFLGSLSHFFAQPGVKVGTQVFHLLHFGRGLGSSLEILQRDGADVELARAVHGSIPFGIRLAIPPADEGTAGVVYLIVMLNEGSAGNAVEIRGGTGAEQQTHHSGHHQQEKVATFVHNGQNTGAAHNMQAIFSAFSDSGFSGHV